MQNKKTGGRIFVVSGPSGSGKTTLIKRVRQEKKFAKNLFKVTTFTTRTRRRGEHSGRDYCFIRKEEFLRRIKKGAFVEWQEIFGQYYGVPKKNLLSAVNNGRDVILCVDVNGALKIRRIFPGQTVLIFISAPSVKSLTSRLESRSTEHSDSVRQRLRIAKKEMRYVKHYDYIIVNDTLTHAVNKLAAVITAERQKL